MDDPDDRTQPPRKMLKPEAGFDQLPPELLKFILSLLDCRRLVEVKRVCRCWYDTAMEILEGAALRGIPKVHDEACLTAFRRLPKSASNIDLGLMVLHNPEMTKLMPPEGYQSPDFSIGEEQETQLDLSIVTRQCRHLENVDLRGFRLTTETLSSLAQLNRRLWFVTLPDGCTDELLEALLENTTLSLVSLKMGKTRGTGRWLRYLPEGIKTLETGGLEAPLERWWPPAGRRYLWRLLLHDCRGLTDSTLSRLPELAPRLVCLLLGGGSGVTLRGLEQLGQLYGLQQLGVGPLARTGADADPVHAFRWLQNIPNLLTNLRITGLEAPLERWHPERGLPSLKMLTVTNCSGVSDSTIACLPDLAPQLHTLTIADCPEVTASGLVHVTRLPRLRTLYLKGTVTDTMLDSLQSCSGLRYLRLGTIQGPPEATVTAAAVSRLAVACRGLSELCIHTTAANGQALVDALHRTELGRDGAGNARLIRLGIPDPVYSQLRSPPSGSRITLAKWP